MVDNCYSTSSQWQKYIFPTIIMKTIFYDAFFLIECFTCFTLLDDFISKQFVSKIPAAKWISSLQNFTLWFSSIIFSRIGTICFSTKFHDLVPFLLSIFPSKCLQLSFNSNLKIWFCAWWCDNSILKIIYLTTVTKGSKSFALVEDDGANFIPWAANSWHSTLWGVRLSVASSLSMSILHWEHRGRPHLSV